MTRPRLLCSTAIVVSVVTCGCNRAETRQDAQDAAAQVRAATAYAGDRLADGWLTTRVQARYFADKDIKARYIDVSSRDGVVTIEGYVDSPRARERALQIARTTEGVKLVNDRLLIGQAPKDVERTSSASNPVATSGRTESPAPTSASAAVDDGQVTNAIQAKYFVDPIVKRRDIAVETHSGVVTLHGAVASETERNQALTLARTTDGVVRVEDSLTVDAAVDRSAPVTRR